MTEMSDTNNMSEYEENIVSRLNLFEELGVTQFQPLHLAVDDYIDFAQHPERRVYTGIKPIDKETRGLAPGEMAIINGFAHNGKTVLVVEILIANEGKPCIVFTPDETRIAVLVKLCAAIHGIGAEELERRINQNDTTAIDALRDVADRFRNLAVFDDNMSLHTMDTAIKSVTESIGAPAFAVFDYADLLNADLEPNEKLKALKRWGKEWDIPFFVLNQSSRSAGAGGKEVTMTSGAYGGEQQAFIMLGVRRKINMLKDQIRVLEEKLESPQLSDKAAIKIMDKIADIRDDQIPRHKDTITVSLVKNKRPPMRLVEDIDYRLDQDTGRLIPLWRDEDNGEQDIPDLPLPEQQTFTHGKSAKELLAERRTQ